jgi:Tol biopolymer transport system component/DNA-binding winged helix-turn-helix (wHTH) protein
MGALKPSPKLFRFGAFEVDIRGGELRKRGIKIKLQLQPFQVLLTLLERPGDVVTREELREKLWPADTFVDFDHGLASAINRLREALSDSPENPRFVETVPRRGYRFIASVDGGPARHEEVEGEAAAAEALRPSSRGAVPKPFEKTRSRFIAMMSAMALIAILGGTGLFLSRKGGRSISPPRIVPFSDLSGFEDQAAVSPDGNELAYAWNSGAGTVTHIYVKLIGAGKPLQLTDDSRSDGDPSWSPDGRYIAFIRYSGPATFGEYGGTSYSSTEVLSIPALGGPERHLGRVNRPAICARDVTWSPDGKSVVVGDKPSPGEPSGLFMLSLENDEKNRITSVPPGASDDSDPAFSPDGQTLAFLRWSADATTDIYLQNVTSGSEPRRLTFEEGYMRGLAWTPDGGGIIFSCLDRSGVLNLWRVPVSGGQRDALAGFGEDGSAPTVSRRGDHLAYTRHDDNINIWRIPATRSARLAKELIAGPREQLSGEFSPDGKQIVFASDRSGNYEIWVASSDGSNPVPLTSFRGRVTGTPHWSPDGRWIAFDSRPGARPGVFVVGVEGGAPRRLTAPATDGFVPTWSRDGKRIYFCSRRSGGLEIWKMPAEGGETVQVTKTGGFEAVESEDGKWLYYSRFGRPGVWKMPVGGGAETSVLNKTTARFWTLADHCLYFMDLEAKPRATINRLELATGKTSRIARVEKDLPLAFSGLSVSPDGQWIIYPQIDAQNSRIMMVENFYW